MRLGFRYLILKLRMLIPVEDGQDLIEYCLIAALLALFVFSSTNTFAKMLIGSYTSIVATFNGDV
jgi:Flp pilus assembly pilin Flp